MRVFSALGLLEGLRAQQVVEKSGATRDNGIVRKWAEDLKIEESCKNMSFVLPKKLEKIFFRKNGAYCGILTFCNFDMAL